MSPATSRNGRHQEVRLVVGTVVGKTKVCYDPFLTFPLLVAASLELMASKENAHSNRVNSVAFSPDGKTIVSGSYDHTIKVWGTLAFLAVSGGLAPHRALSFGRRLVPGFGG